MPAESAAVRVARFLRAPTDDTGRPANRVLHACVAVAVVAELVYTAVSVTTPLVPLAMVLGIASLVFLWRQPLIPLVVNFAVSVLDGPAPFALIISYFVIVSAAPLSRRVALPTALVFVANLRPWNPHFLEQGSWLLLLVLSTIVTGLTLGIGVLVFTRRALLQALHDLDEAHAEARAVATRAAASAERARISREMHDVVSHQVSLIAVQAGALQVHTTDPGAAEVARTIRGLSVATLTELRYLLSALSPEASTAPEIAPQPGLTELPELLRTSGIDAELSIDLDPGVDLDPAIQRAVFRILQEALTNASKHAPGAGVRVRLTSAPDLLVLVVENDAPASSSRSPEDAIPGSGRGLIGARERVELLHGRFLSGPTGDGGFRVTAKIPVPSPSGADVALPLG